MFQDFHEKNDPNPSASLFRIPGAQLNDCPRTGNGRRRTRTGKRWWGSHWKYEPGKSNPSLTEESHGTRHVSSAGPCLLYCVARLLRCESGLADPPHLRCPRRVQKCLDYFPLSHLGVFHCVSRVGLGNVCNLCHHFIRPHVQGHRQLAHPENPNNQVN